jgi:hypothetical protein
MPVGPNPEVTGGEGEARSCEVPRAAYRREVRLWYQARPVNLHSRRVGQVLVVIGTIKGAGPGVRSHGTVRNIDFIVEYLIFLIDG